jgi:hypothetical protein
MYALMAINSPLRTAFAVSHRFWSVVFSYSLTSRSWGLRSVFLATQEAQITKLEVQASPGK